MRQLKTSLAVVGAAVILVLAGSTIVTAATGQNFILGKTNFAGAPTTIERTNAGSPFKITADSTSTSSAPFSTNATGKVINLNADKIDSLDSSALKTTAYKYTTAVNDATTGITITIPLPLGSYVVSYSAYLSGAESGVVACYLEQDPTIAGTSTFMGESRFTAGSQIPGLSGTGAMTKGSLNTVELHCSATNAFTTNSAQPIQIVATRIDTFGANTTLPATRVPASSLARTK